METEGEAGERLVACPALEGVLGCEEVSLGDETTGMG